MKIKLKKTQSALIFDADGTFNVILSNPGSEECLASSDAVTVFALGHMIADDNHPIHKMIEDYINSLNTKTIN